MVVVSDYVRPVVRIHKERVLREEKLYNFLYNLYHLEPAAPLRREKRGERKNTGAKWIAMRSEALSISESLIEEQACSAVKSMDWFQG
jgi:hypothetical protein